jgi:prepilin-type processing-associated H-X9-DG protein
MDTAIALQRHRLSAKRSEVTSPMITDGTSKTYLIGEKFLDPGHYENGTNAGDDQSLYVGFDRDNARSGNILHPPIQDRNVPPMWLPGDDERVTDWNFGSAHASGCYMAFCDGSVRLIDYYIAPGIHSALSGRNDGELIIEE